MIIGQVKGHLFILFIPVLITSGCLRTEGTILLKGKIIDGLTGAVIPGRDVIVQGLVENGDRLIPVVTGEFMTDSSGNFSYKLNKVKDAYSYNFCLVGDSDYASVTSEVFLMELERYGQYLSFKMNRLVDFTIKILRISKSPVCDTLSVSWESDRIDRRNLYPCTIDNHGLTPDNEFTWIGSRIKSTIKTRVFAEKRTIIYWDLHRNGKRKEFTDTIVCRRDMPNIISFKY